MGFVKGNMIPILKECKQRHFHGSLLCLGYPDAYFTIDQFQKMVSATNIDLDPSVELKISVREYFAKLEHISGDSLFKSLGFQQVDILDFSEFEGANIVYDLNNGQLPIDYENKYDAIIDHGTLEHVFHIPNALNNIFKLLKIGGRIIHSSPSSNFVDHGFYMFSPTLFHDFYMANKFILHSIQITQSSPRQDTDPCFYSDYEPGCLSSVSYGGLNDSIFGTICIAEKTPDSTGDIIPQQGLYHNVVWTQKHRNIVDKIASRVYQLYKRI